MNQPPPPALVTSTAAAFLRTGGRIADVVRHVLTSNEFEDARGARVKRPLRYVAGAFRSLGVGTDASPRVLDLLERMGHLPHHYPTPDGYPIDPDPWMGTLLWRWNFALALVTPSLEDSRRALQLRGVRRVGLRAYHGLFRRYRAIERHVARVNAPRRETV